MHTFTLPVFRNSSNDTVMHVLRDLHEYYRIKKVPESPKLPLTMPVVADPIVKIGSVPCTVSQIVVNIAKRFFLKWNSIIQSRIRYSIYQNKLTRQDGESMTSHYLRYANLAANLELAMSEEDLVGALTSHYPIDIQRPLISGHIKTTQCHKSTGKTRRLGRTLPVQETLTELRPPRREPTSV